MKENIFRYGIKNEFIPKTSWYNIKRRIGKRISTSVFNLFLIAVAILIIGMIISPAGCPEPECPECEECKVCEECPEPKKELKIVDTYICPDSSVVADPAECEAKIEDLKKYVCDDETIVDNAEDCKKTIEITTEYQKTDNEITLAVDDMDYELKGDDWGTITQISYAIQNLGNAPILPEVQIKVYNESDPESIKTDTRHTIKINQTLEYEEFVQGIEDTYISFKGINITAKFILINKLEEPSIAKVVLERLLR